MEVERWVSECLKKNRYSSTYFARKVAHKVKQERGTALRIYHCPHCHGYHLTSKNAK